MDLIIAAKDRQAVEANKIANSLLEEINLEKSREQTRKAAAAKKREKRKAKKKDKQKLPTSENQIEQQETQSRDDSPIENQEKLDTNSEIVENNQLSQISSKSPSPVNVLPVKNLSSTFKKKTSTMTRKIERYQENLVSKTKQQQEISPPNNIDDDWKEVSGKQKKLTIPHDQYERLFGRNGINLNLLREKTGALVEIENKRAVGDKTILIK